ncbi:hypothetical protein [Methylobacterium iners]|uniref:Uncharacterized protein n=1 Tax=Methylobacterium iners TaxID=418707 RepID=A0ABQ4RT80_9HYPH|nr:hypothetical protein [Methylobacterium iners]GJD93397.1 hypothetical protein OCOJLMKI_0591 [Methylobacterium iners]
MNAPVRSPAISLLTVEETIAAASRVRMTDDANLRRAATGLSLNAICSMAVLVGQLDAIARSAAAYSTGTPDPDRYAELQERLLAAGYLPLPRAIAEEPVDGAR